MLDLKIYLNVVTKLTMSEKWCLRRVECGYVYLIMNNCIIEAVVLTLQSKEILSKIDFSDITYEINRVLKIRDKNINMVFKLPI